eukprot:gene9044-11078_t
MSSTKEVAVDQLFRDLDEHIQQSQFKKAIRVCNKILGANNADVEAFQCKIICLLQLNHYQEALDCFKTPAQSQLYPFERAYCFYSLKKYQEALNELSSVNKQQKPNKILELEAQIYYKLEKYENTLSIYEDLLKHSDYSDSVEFISNLCAVYIDCGKYKECQDLMNKNKGMLSKTYELVFNSACLSISKGDFKTAETQLKLAKKICTDSLKKDGYSDEDIQEELTSVDVQLAYCQQLNGDIANAIESYENVLSQKLQDNASLVAVNNIVSIKNQDGKESISNLFDQIKTILSEPSNETKLNTQQKKSISFNMLILLLHLKRVSQCEEMIKSLKSKYQSTQNFQSLNEDLDLIEASLLIKEKKFTECEKLLKSGKTLKSQLLLAQLYLLDNNNYTKTLEVLNNLDMSIKTKPGVIATMVALYEKSGNLDKAIDCLDQLINSLESKKNKTEKETDSYVNLLKLSGNFKLKHHKYKEAAQMYEQVLKINANDLFALPSYIVATSHFDSSLSQKYEAKLPNIKFETKVDVDFIEKHGLAYEKKLKSETTTSTTTTTTKTTTPGSKTTTPATGKTPTTATTTKIVKKPKNKLPKNFDPSITPDPERWIPKAQRSHSKTAKSSRKKDNLLFGGSQGVSSTSQAQQLFVPSSTKSTTTTTTTSSTPAAVKPRNAHKKTKKKGSKI